MQSLVTDLHKTIDFYKGNIAGDSICRGRHMALLDSIWGSEAADVAQAE